MPEHRKGLGGPDSLNLDGRRFVPEGPTKLASTEAVQWFDSRVVSIRRQ